MNVITMFDKTQPIETDPALVQSGFAWLPSKEKNVYYAWLQPIAEEVEFHPDLDPLEIALGFGVVLHVYYGRIRQEILYRLIFQEGMPQRFILKPAPYCAFWSFGHENGQSSRIKYHYRDRFVTIHEWTDKSSFLAVLRQQHYNNNTNTIWTR